MKFVGVHIEGRERRGLRGCGSWGEPNVAIGRGGDLLAPHTSGPRDVPRCGALSLLQNDTALQGGSSRNRCELNVKLRDLRGGDWWDLTAYSTRKLKAATRKFKADEKRAHSRAFAVVGLCFSTSLLAARYPARVARSSRTCPRPRHARTCLICCSLLSSFNIHDGFPTN